MKKVFSCLLLASCAVIGVSLYAIYILIAGVYDNYETCKSERGAISRVSALAKEVSQMRLKDKVKPIVLARRR